MQLFIQTRPFYLYIISIYEESCIYFDERKTKILAVPNLDQELREVSSSSH